MPYRYGAPLSIYTDPRRVATAELQTQRYEQNFAADSMLSQQLSQMQVAPLENDQKIAREMQSQYDEILQKRAVRGDYHNMSRQVLLDANQFVKAYTPLKQNHDLYVGYSQGLNEGVEKKNITQDIASNSNAYSLYNNKGLGLDSSGGVDPSSFFSGYKPADYVNIREEQFKVAEKIAKEKFGGSATLKQSGQFGQLYDVVVEGQTVETISEARIKNAVEYMKYEPKIQAYLNQEAMFKTYRLSDEDLGGMLQEYSTKLQAEGSQYKSAELKALFNSRARELESLVGTGKERTAAQELIKDQLFDQATQTTINTFAFKSIYGGGVKSAKVNDVWLEGEKQRLKDLTGNGVIVHTNLKERTPLTETSVDATITKFDEQIKDNIEFLKKAATYEGDITAEQIVAGDYPPEIQAWLDANPQSRNAIVQSIRTASNQKNQFEALKNSANASAIKTTEDIFKVINQKLEEASDPDWNNLTEITSISPEELKQAVQAYEDFKKNYSKDWTFFGSRTAQEISNPANGLFDATSSGVEQPIEKVYKALEIKYNLKEGTLLALEDIPEFINSEEIVSNAYKSAFKELPFPSTSVRATPNFVGSEAVNKAFNKTMPSNFVFSSGQLLEDEQISGKDLAQAGYVIDRVDLLLTNINGQLGYQVTLAPKSADTDPDETVTNGDNVLFLLGDQISTKGLDAVSSNPINIILTDMDAILQSGKTEGIIPLAGGYELEVSDISPNNPMNAMVRVKERDSNKAVYIQNDPATGQSSFVTYEPSSPNYNLTNLPFNSPIFNQIISATNQSGQPALIYGK